MDILNMVCDLYKGSVDCLTMHCDVYRNCLYKIVTVVDLERFIYNIVEQFQKLEGDFSPDLVPLFTQEINSYVVFPS